MAGDYNWFKKTYTNKSKDSMVLAATDYTTATAIISAKSASHQLVIQKITVNPTTYAAKTWTFQDSAGTPVPVALLSIPVAAPTTGADGEFWFDFGPEGLALTTGKNLNLIMSATGAAAAIHIEAYERLVGPVAIATLGALTN